MSTASSPDVGLPTNLGLRDVGVLPRHGRSAQGLRQEPRDTPPETPKTRGSRGNRLY